MRKKRKLSKHARPYRPLLEHLEDRRVLATFTEVGSLLDIDLNVANEKLTVTAFPDGYLLSLADSVWTGTNTDFSSGSGTSELAVMGIDISDIPTTLISIRDSATGASVEFADSDSDTKYVASVDVRLDEPGASEVIFTGTTEFLASAGIDIETTRNVRFDSGSALKTVDGDISIVANMQDVATSGDFHGVLVGLNSTIATTGGHVLVKGQSGGTSNSGVLVYKGGVVRTLTDGNITLKGIGASESDSLGTSINESSILAVNGDITIHGTGGQQGTSGTAHGFVISNGAKVSTSGNGNITLEGQGGTSSGDYNNGVYITHSDTVVSTESGALSINGTAGGSGASKGNYGVHIGSSGDQDGGATVFSNTGIIRIKGHGGSSSGGGNRGLIVGESSTVAVVDGEIQLIGQGGISQNPLSNSEKNRGTEIDRGAVRATGSGDIKISGLGGNTSNFNSGVYIHGTSGQISVENGNLHIEGTGGSTDDAGFNDGVYVRNGATISSAGDGSINIIGLGGQSSGPENRGIHIDDDVSITATGDGGLHINGTGGLGSVSGTGVRISDSSSLTSATADIYIEGHGKGDANSNNNYGVSVRSDALVSTTTGNIHVSGTGGFTSGDENTGIKIWHDSIVTTVDGDISVIGHSGGDVESLTSGGGGSYIGSRLTATGNGNVLIEGTGRATGTRSNGVVISGGNALVATDSGTLRVDGKGGESTDKWNRGVGIWNGSKVTTATGEIQINGIAGGKHESFSNRGVQIIHGQVEATATGNITIRGNGGISNGGGNVAVAVEGTGAIRANIGDILVHGNGGTMDEGGSNHGIAIWREGSIESIGVGNVHLIGVGARSDGGYNHGIQIANVDAGVSVTNGNLHIEGTGGGTDDAGFNDGVYVRNGATISSAGDGSINIIGLGGQSSGSGNRGIHIDDDVSITATGDGGLHINGTGGLGSVSGTGVRISDSSSLTSATADIYIEGHGKGDANSNNNHGVNVRSDALVSTTTGNIEINGIAGGKHESFSNRGVQIIHGQLEATATGNITIQGNGGISNGGDNVGVAFAGADSVKTKDGDIFVHGNAGTMREGGGNRGIGVWGRLESSGIGNVHLIGVGAKSDGDYNHGVSMVNDIAGVSVTNGGIVIEGHGGGLGKNSHGNHGVVIRAAAQLNASGSGDIHINSHGGLSQGNYNVGFVSRNGADIATNSGNITIQAFTGQGSAAPAAAIADQGVESAITTDSGKISIRSDSIKLTQLSTVETGQDGSVAIRPMTEGRTVELGVPDITYSNLSLSNLSLSRVSTSHLQIGSSRTGEISITEPIILPSKTDVTITSPKAIQAMDGSLDTNGGSLVLSGNSTGHIKLLSHGTDLVSATTTLEAGTHFAATINGTDVDTLYTQANLIGTVDISGAVLTINGGYTPSLGDVFTIINNDGDDSITGTFSDLPEGSHVSLNNVPLKISYLGATGNDVTLTAVSISPSIDPITDITIHENDGLQSISLTGIAPGSTDNSPVRVTAESQNTLLVSTVETVYTSPQTTGLLKFQPVADMAGSTVITVTVEDGGLDEDLSTTADNAEAQVQFNVRVLEAHPWHNYNFPEDVNGDGQVTPVDALSIINEINQGGAGVLPESRNEIAPPFYDVNKDGNLSPLDALIVINHINSEDYMMSIDVTFTNVSGHTLSEVEVGSVFYLTLSSTDLSEENEGVFAAYADVYYDTTMVSAAGVAQFISPYVNGKHVDTAVAGILDEWGAFGGIEPPDSSRVVISSIPMRAERVGQALFGMDAADESPLHDPLLFGVMDAIPIDAVRFGSATLDIVEAAEGEYLESVDSVFKDYD